MEFSALNFVIATGSSVVVAVLSIAQQRRVSREQYEASKQEWSDIALRKEEHIKTLEHRVADMQDQINQANVVISRVQAQAESWTRRNAQLYELCQELRTRLARFGEHVPDPNGDSE